MQIYSAKQIHNNMQIGYCVYDDWKRDKQSYFYTVKLQNLLHVYYKIAIAYIGDLFISILISLV